MVTDSAIEGSSPYVVRLLKAEDATQLALLQTRREPQAVVSLLGVSFTATYLRIVLAHPMSVGVGAFSLRGALLGAVIGSLDAAAQLRAVRHGRAKLAARAFSSVVARPMMVRDLVRRYRAAGSSSEANQYIVAEGARLENWFWDDSEPSAGGPIQILQVWLGVMRQLGVSSVRFEVDADLPRVARLHKALGAKVVRRTTTPVGKAREFLEYSLDK